VLFQFCAEAFVKMRIALKYLDLMTESGV
jgi:hypothetical protein